MTGAAAGPAGGIAPTAQLSALADDTRWRILELLGSRPRSASELATELPVSRQAIAKHLAVLEAAGLVDAVREGRSVRHRAIGARLSALADRLDAIGRGWEQRLERLAHRAEAGQAQAGQAKPAPDGG
ncbi:Helix-turn-helix domain-containing protein [Agrococcus baldri]|uniref:Helix-turn-helix domain-containing protein n=1 Tax=Agrococcus baldri TaxID=153730 RepID=A0AA94HP67_9MICO|nr:metalloregulator ArsR/SmtB family transcription factor [Agrococcus baldri]SFS16579.1 Helix-turn-helix domain-containing protein [Agrococcus baldri]